MMQQNPDNLSTRMNAAWLAYLTTTNTRSTALMGLIRRCSGENNDPAADAARNLADREILAAVNSLEHARNLPETTHEYWSELLQRAEDDVAQARAGYEASVVFSVIDRPDLAAPTEDDTWHTPRLRLIATVRGIQLLAQRAESLNRSTPGSTAALAYADAVHIGNEIAEDEKEKIIQHVNQGQDQPPRPRGANRRLDQQAQGVTIDQALAVNAVKAIRRPHLNLMVTPMLHELEPSMDELHGLYHQFQEAAVDTMTKSTLVRDPHTSRTTTAAIVLIEHGDFISAKLAHEHFPKGYRTGDAFVHIQALLEHGENILANAPDQQTHHYGQQLIDAGNHLMRTLESGIHDVQLHDIRDFVIKILNGPYTISSVKRAVLPSISGEDPQLAEDIGKYIDVNRLARTHRGPRRQPNSQDTAPLMDSALTLGLPPQCLNRLAEFLGFDPAHLASR